MHDVIVIGGGPAGMAAAMRAAELGADVAVVERGRLGGVSTNDGCVPVRALAHAARLRREADQFELYGLDAAPPTVDFPRVLARTQQVVDQIHAKKDLLGNLERAGVRVYSEVGETHFIDEHTLGLANGVELNADKFIICTGGHGRRVNFPGGEYAMTHSDIWSLKALPKSVVVVGSGATGCQLASVLNAFGTQVYLFERSSQILKTEDELVSQVVAEEFQKHGVQLVTGFGDMKAIEKQGDAFRFVYTIQDQEHSLECDAVILAVGWPGNVESLNLPAAHIEKTARGYIQVDKYLQTTAPNIYAAGDVTGLMMLVSGATHEARIAAENAVLGNKRVYKHHIVPCGSFTDPEYAGVGMREQEARAQGLDYITATVYYADFVRAIVDDRTAGFCKLIADVDSRQILGAHVVGERAVETVNLVAAGMRTGMRLEQLAELELAYPTYVAIVGLTARELGRQLGLAMGAGQWQNHWIPTGKSLS